MNGAEHGGICSLPTPGIFSRQLHDHDVAPALACDVLAGYGRHLRRLLDADDRSVRASGRLGYLMCSWLFTHGIHRKYHL
jgi:hypothetical protein